MINKWGGGEVSIWRERWQEHFNDNTVVERIYKNKSFLCGMSDDCPLFVGSDKADNCNLPLSYMRALYLPLLTTRMLLNYYGVSLNNGVKYRCGEGGCSGGGK